MIREKTKVYESLTPPEETTSKVYGSSPLELDIFKLIVLASVLCIPIPIVTRENSSKSNDPERDNIKLFLWIPIKNMEKEKNILCPTYHPS